MRSEVVEIIPRPKSYYRNQIQDSRGRWRDVAPEFPNLKTARDAAEILSLEGGDVRIVKYTNEEENN